MVKEIDLVDMNWSITGQDVMLWRAETTSHLFSVEFDSLFHFISMMTDETPPTPAPESLAPKSRQ